jgi:hypothetical protein
VREIFPDEEPTVSLRDYFAAAALQNLDLLPMASILDPRGGGGQTAAEAAYIIADAMLAEREKLR